MFYVLYPVALCRKILSHKWGLPVVICEKEWRYGKKLQMVPIALKISHTSMGHTGGFACGGQVLPGLSHCLVPGGILICD